MKSWSIWRRLTKPGSDCAPTTIFPEIDTHRFSRLAMALNAIKVAAPLKVAVVSSVLNEGVSTVSVNLAQALRRTLNWRTLLIDTNLPNPSLHRLAPTVSGVGLAGVLRGDASLELATQRLSDYGFGLIPAGSYIDTDLPILFSRMFTPRIFAAMNPDQWDAVILDCPPLLAYPGSSLIAAQADATVMVIRAEYTRYYDASKALEYLEEDGSNVLGVIMNDIHYCVPEWLYRRL